MINQDLMEMTISGRPGFDGNSGGYGEMWGRG